MKAAKSNRLLLIAPLFFGYYKEIIEEAERSGYDVDYVCDAPSNSNISKAIARINKNLIKHSTNNYFKNSVIPQIKGKNYDYLLLVAGMTFSFTPDMVEILRKMNPNTIFVMYQWDSEKNLPYSTKIHCFFDEVYSFDRFDCESKSLYHFLPLFYTKKFEMIGRNEVTSFKYDCSYVGTAHPQKYKSINDMSKAIVTLMPKQFIYHYMPSKLKYIYHKVTAPEYRTAKLNDFKSEKITTTEMMNIFKYSRCILDSPQAGQNGLTMRTIECLGAKRKLITTNKDIENYDFYRKENILVFDGKIDCDLDFFKTDFLELPKDIYTKYSLNSWLKTMLTNHQEKG